MEKSLTYEDLMKGQKVLSYCVIAGPPACETTTDYRELTDRLMANEKEEYKNLILSFLDYKRPKEISVADDEMKRINETKLVEIVEVNLNDLKLVELYKIARDLWIKNFMLVRKRELVKKIESAREYFCNKNKE